MHSNRGVRAAQSQATGLHWVLVAIASSLPWLIPVHSEPWSTFHSELAAALVAMPVALYVIVRPAVAWRLDALALGFAAAALIPLLQAVFGLFLFPAEAPLVSLYLFGFALATATARRCESHAPGRLADALFVGLALAALASTGLALAQWLKLEPNLFMAPVPLGGRAAANLGHANQLSTLLVWGLVAMWWAHVHGRIGGAVAVFSAVFLFVGIASTQSRTGWLEVALLLGAALVAHRRLGTTNQRTVFIGLGLWFLLLVLGWDRATQEIAGHAALTLDDQLSAGKRPAIWAMMLDGARHRPWAGYGWNQGRLVQVAELPNYTTLQVGVQHAHNLVLDLMVWNGIPLGLGLAVLLGLWFTWQWRRAASAPQVLLLLALGSLLLHSMLELPHCNAYFLVPAALMMGTLNARTNMPSILEIPRSLMAVAVFGVAGVLVILCVDYRRIELNLVAYRLYVARVVSAGHVGEPTPPAPPPIEFLTALQDALTALRTEPRAGMNAQELENLRKTLERYPVEDGLYRYAAASALNNQPDRARQALQRLCDLHTAVRCEAAEARWAVFGSDHPEIDRVPFPSR